MGDDGETPRSELTPRLREFDEATFHRSVEEALDQLNLGLVLSQDSKVTYANPAFERLLGYSPSELAERDLFSLLAENQRPSSQQRFEARRAGDDIPDHVIVRARHKDGHIVDIEVSIARLPGSGFPLLTIVRDVTEDRAAEWRARQSHKMDAIGQLAGGIAHDFNNYLTAVRLTTESLQDAEDDEQRGELIAELEQLTSSAASLTRQLLTFGGRDVSKPSVLDVNIIIFEMLAMLQRLMGDRVELVPQLEPGLPPVRVDEGQLQQILVNLVVNAQLATSDEGGRVTIETCIPDDRSDTVSLVIRDTGAGMTPEVLERAFEPFFTTRPESASGMGLAIVYGIVLQCGGTIDISSTPGRGTRVRVDLPTTDSHAPRRRQPTPVMIARHATRLLLLEDEPKIRDLLIPRLEAYGFTVESVHNGRQALEAIESGRVFDVLVADIVVPGPRGVEVAREFRERQPDGAVVFISGYPDVYEPDEWRSSRVAFLPKPFSAAELAATIREIAG